MSGNHDKKGGATTQEIMLPKLACRGKSWQHFALSPTCRRHVADITSQGDRVSVNTSVGAGKSSGMAMDCRATASPTMEKGMSRLMRTSLHRAIAQCTVGCSTCSRTCVSLGTGTRWTTCSIPLNLPKLRTLCLTLFLSMEFCGREGEAVLLASHRRKRRGGLLTQQGEPSRRQC